MRNRGRLPLVVLGVALCCVADPSPGRCEESAVQAPAARRFSLEFRDADIKDVLRLLGQENGLNILVGDDVTGKVTVSFKEVTLNQALDAILESFGYSYSTNDQIVVVRKTPIPKATTGQIVIDARDVAAAGGAPAHKLFSLDCRDAEAKDVLRLFSQKSGLNIVVGDEVTGKISMSIRDVTIDQALLSILQSFACSFSFTDGIVLVTRNPNSKQFVSRAIKISHLIDTNTTEEPDRSGKQLEALADSLRPMLSPKPSAQLLGVQERRSNSADAVKALAGLGNASGSGDSADASRNTSQGERVTESGPSIRVFPRINTIVVTDVPERVDKIAALLKELDTPTPQIKIEARIVEVKDTYQKELGVQWGAEFNADSAHGNSTDYAFPNSVSVGGTEGTDGNYLVNLPASSSTAGVGISLGHIANILSLDLKLSAMEKMKKIKILSTPSVMAMQGKEAIIKVGNQVPIFTTDTATSGSSTESVSFKDIVLQLRVVPTVLPGGKILLDLVVNKDSRGEEVTVQGEKNFSIDTKSVTTRVALLDGETGVVGGLYSQQEDGSTSQVPLLGKIPLLGWLFRSRSDEHVRNELLIFLTPRIQP